MNIEHKLSLEKKLKDGINLFLGAGFSLYAKNHDGLNLPLSSELTKELIEKFNCPSLHDLSRVCTIIDSTDSEALKEYLVKRFKVNEFEDFYKNLIQINSPRIFTTNIDNLAYRIFETTNLKYLNNVFINGSCYQDSKCVDYIPIHGCVELKDEKFLFNKKEVSGSFRTEQNAWINLRHSASQLPSLFMGYSLEDVGAIESLFGSEDSRITQKEKWILLHKANPGSEAYFKALGFKIIIADIKEFLEYIGELQLGKTIYANKKNFDFLSEIFPEACVPRDNYKGRVRQIDEFFLGAHPIWSDVLSNRIASTNHLEEISNLVEHNKNIIITGIPASGKSTLMLQLANRMKSSKRVFLFSDLTLNKSNIIKNEIKTDTLLLIDNFTSDIDSFINLSTNSKIKLVGFDRYYNVDISYHKLASDKFITYDVSDISKQDVQKIYNSIPLSIRKPKMVVIKDEREIPSLFEIVNYNINKPELKDRYHDVIEELNTSDPILLDLLIMTCYMHSCRVPVSFEVANSFLYDNISSYEEVHEMMESLRGLVQEAFDNVINELNQDQDYYQPRSQVLAETIISQTKPSYFRRVFQKFHECVPRHLIPNYHVFKRNGYDAFYVNKAFMNWSDGLEFYNMTSGSDKDPFLLQQCSLYLLKKKRYVEAAIKIDQALQNCHKRIFSIENTHAIILFNANINLLDKDNSVRLTLDKSMGILKKCYNEDKRKTYHAVTFAEQSIEYYSKYPDNLSNENLILAQKWLIEIQNERQYHMRSRDLLKKINEIL